MIDAIKKNLQDFIGGCIGAVTGWISSGFYKDWIQPMILAAVCAFIGVVITHYGRKLLNTIDNKVKSPKWKQNGRK